MNLKRVIMLVLEWRERGRLIGSINASAARIARGITTDRSNTISAQTGPCHTEYTDAVSIRGSDDELRVCGDGHVYHKVENDEGEYFVPVWLFSYSLGELRTMDDALKLHLRPKRNRSLHRRAA